MASLSQQQQNKKKASIGAGKTFLPQMTQLSDGLG
jgi:hypothetical protein